MLKSKKNNSYLLNTYLVPLRQRIENSDDISYVRLSKQLDISVVTLYNYLNGISKIPLSVYIDLCTILNVKLKLSL